MRKGSTTRTTAKRSTKKAKADMYVTPSDEIKELHREHTNEEWEKEKPTLIYEEKGLETIQESVEESIEKEMTPSQYFEMLKEMKGSLTTSELENFINSAMDTMETLSITGQKYLADTLMVRLQLALKEYNAVKNGYEQVINRTDLEVWVHDIHKKSNKDGDEKNATKPIHVIEMERYQRPIPKDVIKKLKDAKKYFEQFYIVFTDYTGESERIVEKEKRDKDPVLFGTFMVKTKGGNVRPGEHLFFIADWIDEFCDLTFSQILKEYSKETKREMTIPYEKLIEASPEELENYFTNNSENATL